MLKRRKRFTKRGFNLKLKRETVFSIAQVFFFAVAGLIIVSFARRGIVLVRLNDILVHYFSWATIFLPFILLSFGALLSKIKLPLGQPNVVVGSLLFFVSILSLGRAGVLGRTSWEGVSSLVTSAGAFILLTGTTICGLIILFNTSFDQVFRLISLFIAGVKQYTVGAGSFGKGLGR